MSFVYSLLVAAQTVPLTPPMVDIESVTDSAERQTLPGYKIDCSLVDERSDRFGFTLRQTGGRGVKATLDELGTLPAWRKFVRTPVHIEILSDQAKLFGAAAIDVAATDDSLHWNANLNGYSRPSVSLRGQNDKIVTLEILGHTSNDNGRTSQSRVAVAFSRSTVHDGRPQVKLVGFCSVAASPQLPLSSGEESEFHKK